jgi:hypothetical protein
MLCINALQIVFCALKLLLVLTEHYTPPKSTRQTEFEIQIMHAGLKLNASYFLELCFDLSCLSQEAVHPHFFPLENA